MIIPADRTSKLTYAIRNLARIAEAREQSGLRVIYLNIGDPQMFGFRPPEHLTEAVARAIKSNFTGYSHSAGLLEAREAVAMMADSLGTRTNPNEVMITAGASEAADMLLTALVGPGDEVLLPAPGYPLYSAILSKLGGVARYYKLKASQRWQPDLEQVSSLINERTRALVLINPNNPTGAIVDDQTVEQLVRLTTERGLLMIADEVYRDLCFTRPSSASSVFAQAFGGPHITLESLSKTHLVPGWRIGWMRYTNSPKMLELIGAINRIADTRLCAPTPCQYAVRPALQGDKTFQQRFMDAINTRRLSALDLVRQARGLDCDTPEAGFFMMVKVDDPARRTDEGFVLNLLEKTGVLVVHGSGLGAEPRDCYFRLVYLADEEILRIALGKIDDFLRIKS